MGKEYIEREALKEWIHRVKNGLFYTVGKTYIDFDVVHNAILETPAADVEPVVHGEWIPIVSYFHGKPDGRYYCSVCHRVETMKGIYCRLCGALMDGGKPNA